MDVMETIKKELTSLGRSSRAVYESVPLKLLPKEDQAKVIKSCLVC